MKSLILYGSPTKLTNAHKLVTVPSQGEYYVRVELFDGDCMTALESATPQEGESVLNTIDKDGDGAFVSVSFTK